LNFQCRTGLGLQLGRVARVARVVKVAKVLKVAKVEQVAEVAEVAEVQVTGELKVRVLKEEMRETGEAEKTADMIHKKETEAAGGTGHKMIIIHQQDLRKQFLLTLAFL
jgi:hypothetical protein